MNLFFNVFHNFLSDLMNTVHKYDSFLQAVCLNI